MFLVIAENQRQELKDLILNDFAYAWDCVRPSLANYGKFSTYHFRIKSEICDICIVKIIEHNVKHNIGICCVSNQVHTLNLDWLYVMEL